MSGLLKNRFKITWHSVSKMSGLDGIFANSLCQVIFARSPNQEPHIGVTQKKMKYQTENREKKEKYGLISKNQWLVNQPSMLWNIMDWIVAQTKELMNLWDVFLSLSCQAIFMYSTVLFNNK